MISKAPWYKNVVEAVSYDAYYCCFDEVTHRDPDPTASYERDYGPLEKRIQRLLVKHGLPKTALQFFDDWCPNRTRHVWVEARFVTAPLISALYGLLRGKYQFWRIELILVGTIEKDDLRGMVALQKQWVLCFGTGRKLIAQVKRTES